MADDAHLLDVRVAAQRVLDLGKQLWPFPFPIVKGEDGKWAFDTVAGLEEIVNRRIGENELQAIETARLYADAQRAYAEEDRDGDGYPNSVDCNDDRAHVHPGAEEIDYDGIDQDCTGGEDQDFDDDGLVASQLGGPDCDDRNAFVRQCPEEEKGCNAAPGAWYLGLLALPLLRRRRR